jgi:coenzyme A diphosphatase NUDT7
MSAGSSSSQQNNWSSERLRILAEHFRDYKAPPLQLNGGPSVKASSEDLTLTSRKKKAAVLVCLYESLDGEVRAILTKRSGTLSSHSGDVALPGGKRDESDAALREAQEEIGLLPSQIRVVKVLEPFISLDYMGVTPVIGFLEDVVQFKPAPNPGEVDAVFDVPLEMFLRTDNYSFIEREWLGVTYRVHSFKFTGKVGAKFVIYGLTASVLVRTAAIVYKREPDFLEMPPYFRLWSHLPEAIGTLQ